MRNALAISRGLSRLLAAYLMVLLAVQPVLSAVPARDGHQGHDCDCGHGSCPMRRPVKKAEPPACHGAEAAEAHPAGHSMTEAPAPAPAPVRSGDSCSLSATCGCGHPHSPSAPHRDHRAVLALEVDGGQPEPAGLLILRPGPAPSEPFPVPEPPPPRA